MGVVNNIVDYVLSGYYEPDDEKFDLTNINYMAEWVFREIVWRNGDIEMYELWIYEDKIPQNNTYLNLLYYSACAILDNIRFEAGDEAQRKSILYFTKDLLNYIAINEKNNQINEGGTKYWMRLGNVHCLLGDCETAIEIYNEGISKMKRLSKWKSGMLIGYEKDLEYDFSMIEWLYAARGRCEYELNRKDQAKATIEFVLASINKRGHNDLMDKHFPEGIRIYLE